MEGEGSLQKSVFCVKNAPSIEAFILKFSLLVGVCPEEMARSFYKHCFVSPGSTEFTSEFQWLLVFRSISIA